MAAMLLLILGIKRRASHIQGECFTMDLYPQPHWRLLMLAQLPSLSTSFIPEPDMNGYVDFSPSPTSPTKEPGAPQPTQAVLQEDVDMSSGSSGNENCSTGRDSQGSDCDDNGKELRMLVESSNTHPRWVSLRPGPHTQDTGGFLHSLLPVFKQQVTRTCRMAALLNPVDDIYWTLSSQIMIPHHLPIFVSDAT